jgi:outer membrane biosynthesis protein TonB
VVETPQPEPVVETPQPEPAPIVPPPDPVPPPEPITTPEPEAVPVAKVEPTDPGGRPEVVVVPELQPARTSAGPESASDLLDRLVEPVADHGPSDAANDLRAKLARTAAIKKPGSKERREADEQNRS